jgi:phosphatidylglycerophosphate synthase
MNLNDPFGRLQRRDEAGYDSMRQNLQVAGIDSADGVRQVMANTRRNVLTFCAIVVLSALLLLGLLPKLAPVTLSLALLLLVVAGNALIKGQRYLKRYIDEELGNGKPKP